MSSSTCGGDQIAHVVNDMSALPSRSNARAITLSDVERRLAWQRLDLFLALTAGPAAWRHSERADHSDLTAGLLQITAIGGALTLSAMHVRQAVSAGGSGRLWLYLLFLVIAATSLLAPTVRWLAGRVPAERRVGIRTLAIIRSVEASLLAIFWIACHQGIGAEASWLFGAAVGCEAALTGRAVGFEFAGRSPWFRAFTSAPHLGAVLGVALAAILIPTAEGRQAALELYGALLVIIATGVITVSILDHLRRQTAAVEAAAVAAERAHQRRDRAHWLHDDVCSQLRFVQVKLETGRLDLDGVTQELRALDHRLRVRQLEDHLATGAVRLAEVLQPYIRQIQAQGVFVAAVPRFEDAALVLAEPTARLVQRAAAVFTTNAIQAGATRISLRTYFDERDALVVEVEDDAGGFDATVLPAGRGLEALRHEVGGRHFRIESTDIGSRCSISIPFIMEPSRDHAAVAG